MPEERVQHSLKNISIKTLIEDMLCFIPRRVEEDGDFVGVLFRGGQDRRAEILKALEDRLISEIYRNGGVVERLDLTDSACERRTAEQMLSHKRRYPGCIFLIYDPCHEIAYFDGDLTAADLNWANVLRQRGTWPPPLYNFSFEEAGFSNRNVYTVDLSRCG